MKRRVISMILSSRAFRDVVRLLFEKSLVQSEADLRWRLGWALEHVIHSTDRIGNWHVHSEVPFRVKIAGQTTMRRPDLVVSTDMRNKVKAAIEIKVFRHRPTRSHLAKDVETLCALSRLGFVETGCLLYLYPGEDALGGGAAPPVFRTKAKWTEGYLLQVPIPLPAAHLDTYFAPWKWQ